MLIITNSF